MNIMELKLDFTLATVEERLLEVESITELWRDFGLTFTNKQLEYISNYLLAKTSREERQAYKVLSQDEFDKKIRFKGDVSIYQNAEGAGGASNVEGIENILEIAKPASNDYINMEWKVTTDDIKGDSAMGSVLRDYQKTKLHIIDLKNQGEIDIKTYRSLLGNINDDMVMVKKIFKGATKPSYQASWLGDKIDYDIVDYTNIKHIEAILRTINLESEIVPNNTLTLIAEDMRVTIRLMIKQGILNTTDEIIISGINAGDTLKDISLKVNIQESGVRKRFIKICSKIAQHNMRIMLRK